METKRAGTFSPLCTAIVPASEYGFGARHGAGVLRNICRKNPRRFSISPLSTYTQALHPSGLTVPVFDIQTTLLMLLHLIFQFLSNVPSLLSNFEVVNPAFNSIVVPTFPVPKQDDIKN